MSAAPYARSGSVERRRMSRTRQNNFSVSGRSSVGHPIAPERALRGKPPPFEEPVCTSPSNAYNPPAPAMPRLLGRGRIGGCAMAQAGGWWRRRIDVGTGVHVGRDRHSRVALFTIALTLTTIAQFLPPASHHAAAASHTSTISGDSPAVWCRLGSRAGPPPATTQAWPPWNVRRQQYHLRRDRRDQR
jgi:hypothetical protein